MSATTQTRTASEQGHEETAVTSSLDVELRDAAIANLKRKRKFAQDTLGFIAVNGVLQHSLACLGHSDLGLPARDRRMAGVRQLARKPEPADHRGRHPARDESNAKNLTA